MPFDGCLLRSAGSKDLASCTMNNVQMKYCLIMALVLRPVVQDLGVANTFREWCFWYIGWRWRIFGYCWRRFQHGSLLVGHFGSPATINPSREQAKSAVRYSAGRRHLFCIADGRIDSLWPTGLSSSGRRVLRSDSGIGIVVTIIGDSGVP
jgi:hypothetical protein